MAHWAYDSFFYHIYLLQAPLHNHYNENIMKVLCLIEKMTLRSATVSNHVESMIATFLLLTREIMIGCLASLKVNKDFALI
ncbi:MAG: hypothetical protein AB1782_01670 [Cyanobacteriota bacterium]